MADTVEPAMAACAIGTVDTAITMQNGIGIGVATAIGAIIVDDIGRFTSGRGSTDIATTVIAPSIGDDFGAA